MLVHCSVYKDGIKIADAQRENIKEFLGVENQFVWVALSHPSPQEVQMFQREFGLHELMVEDLLHAGQRSKVEEYDEMLFVVVKTVEEVEKKLSLGEVHIFIGAHFIMSVRILTEKNLDMVKHRVEKDFKLMRFGPGFVLYAILDTLVDRYFPIIDRLEEELEQIEDQMFLPEGRGADIVESLYSLKQRVVLVKHSVTPLFESVGKLHGGRVPKICLETQEYFQDVHDHLYRINQTIDSLRDMILTAIQVNLSIMTAAETEVSKKLAGWAAMIGVPTLIAGVYGMNFQNMPELQWYWGYPITLVLMVIIDGYLYYRFKRSGWI